MFDTIIFVVCFVLVPFTTFMVAKRYYEDAAMVARSRLRHLVKAVDEVDTFTNDNGFNTRYYRFEERQALRRLLENLIAASDEVR